MTMIQPAPKVGTTISTIQSNEFASPEGYACDNWGVAKMCGLTPTTTATKLPSNACDEAIG